MTTKLGLEGMRCDGLNAAVVRIFKAVNQQPTLNYQVLIRPSRQLTLARATSAILRWLRIQAPYSLA